MAAAFGSHAHQQVSRLQSCSQSDVELKECNVLERVSRAFDWILNWSVTAFCAAIVWEFVSRGSIQLFAHSELTFARAAWLLACFGVFILLEWIVEIWWVLARRMRAEYSPQDAFRVNLVISALFLTFAAPPVWLFQWLLRLLWQYAFAWAWHVRPTPASAGPLLLGWPAVLLLRGASIGLFYVAVRSVPASVSRFGAALRCLGPRRLLKGILLTTLLRLRQPRRDLFSLSPIVSDMLLWAVCASLNVWLAGTVYALTVPVPLLVWSVLWAIAKCSPPLWLYLGATEFDSFRVFHTLRGRWYPFTGITLLNRESEAGFESYYAERNMFRRRFVGDLLYLNPRAPRIWSLRTRAVFWPHTVQLLMDLVIVVVVDVRTASEMVCYELEWLARSGRMEKAWFLTSGDSRPPAFSSAASEPLESVFPPERFVTEDMLYGATWTPDGIRITTPIL